MTDRGGKAASIAGSVSKRFDALLLASASIVWWTNADGEFIDEQPYWQAYTGQTWEEYQGSRWISCLHPEDRDSIVEDWTRAVASGGPYLTEGRIWSAKHRSYRAFQTRGIAIRDDAGRIYEWLGALTDIQDTIDIKALLETTRADLAQSLKALRLSEARSRAQASELQAVYDAAPMGIAVLDRDGRYLRVNRALARMNGFEAKAHIGKSLDEIIPGMGSEVTSALQKVLDERRVIQLELTGSTAADPGATGHWQDTLFPIDLPDGTVVGVIVEETTERKLGEAALRESEGRLRLALDSADLGSWDVDLKTGAAVWNRRHATMQGFDLDAGTPTMDLWKSRVHPDDIDRIMAAFDRAARERSLIAEEHRYTPAGSTEVRWMSLYGRFAYDDNGHPLRVSGVSLDITERKRSEENLRLLMQEVNHRSKNMLGLVQSVARHTLAATPDEFLQRFGERLNAMAASQDLLVRGGWDGVDVLALVRAQLAHFADLVGVRITCTGPALKIVPAAAQTLGMALHELATNAGKYGALSSEHGRVDIAWDLHRRASGGFDFSMAWTERDGPPMSKPKRTGFGSTVIGSVVRMSLDCEPLLGYDPVGFSWRIFCPAAKVVDGYQVPSMPESTSMRSRDLPNSSAPRVLVVEDEPMIALEIASVLSQAGYAVLGPASSVRHALALLEESACDAAILDINLGSETSERIADKLVAMMTPFVVVSGYSKEQHPRAFAGCFVMPKPLKASELIGALSTCLDRRVQA